MGLRAWLLRNRLQSVERRLRKKRFQLKKLRDRAADAEESQSRLEAERHKVTAEIEVLVARERRLKEEMAAGS